MNWGAAFRDELGKCAAFVAAHNGVKPRIGGGAQNVGVVTPARPTNSSAAQAAHAVRQTVARAKPPLPTVSGVR